MFIPGVRSHTLKTFGLEIRRHLDQTSGEPTVSTICNHVKNVEFADGTREHAEVESHFSQTCGFSFEARPICHGVNDIEV